MEVAHGAVAVPLAVRLHLGRAAVQVAAQRCGADILHIKGDAVDPDIRPPGRWGTDVDILVRPRDVGILHGALADAGWTVYSSFATGSPFGHAQTYAHDHFGYLDVHRFFPGIERAPSAAFDHLWASRSAKEFGGISCPIPSPDDQAVILILNAARNGGSTSDDMRHLWTDADDEARARRQRQVDLLEAQVAFDAARGEIERHRGARTYRMWRAVSTGGGRLAEWWGRVVAARSIRQKIRLVLRAPLVNTEHLAHRLGRAPTPREVLVEFVARPVRGLAELRGRSRR